MNRSLERQVLCFLNLMAMALAAALLSGCGAARAGRFEAFAATGLNYAQVRSQFLRHSLDVSIERDTLELRKQHEALDAAGRARVLTEQDNIVRERIAILSDLDRHGALMSQYFLALARLASPQADANAAAAATRLSGELGGLTNALSKKTLNGNPISELLGQATGLAVGRLRNRALEKHLKEHSQTVQRELALEEQLLRVLTDEMIADRRALQAHERRTVLVPPFRGDRPPPEWDAERKRFLLVEVDLTRARAAQDAAQQLRRVFESLAGGANDGGLAELQAAIARVNQFLGPGGK
jgi:hypothetical protein